MKKLPRLFYERDTHIVAKELLGKVLVRKWRGKLLAGRIWEVECYVGENDKACHARKGKTKRNEVMFGRAGHAYVYFIYGMYNCLNMVTEEKDWPAAVLIRGIKQISVLPKMEKVEMGIKKKQTLLTQPSPLKRERRSNNILGKLDGPGKLTRALHISRAQNKEDLTTSDNLFVIDNGWVKPGQIQKAERIGVDYAEEDAKLKWRYFLSAD